MAYLHELEKDYKDLEAQLAQAMSYIAELEGINETIRNWNACEEHEYKNLLAELEQYKKALELACNSNYDCPHVKYKGDYADGCDARCDGCEAKYWLDAAKEAVPDGPNRE